MALADQKGEEGGDVTEETFKTLHEQYLRNLKLQGVEGIRKAFIREVRLLGCCLGLSPRNKCMLCVCTGA